MNIFRRQLQLHSWQTAIKPAPLPKWMAARPTMLPLFRQLGTVMVDQKIEGAGGAEAEAEEEAAVAGRVMAVVEEAVVGASVGVITRARANRKGKWDEGHGSQ